VDAESVVQTRIFADAQADIRRERNVTLVGLAALTVLALLGVWMPPRGVTAPFRPLLRAWIRGILGERKALLRAERLALAGEAAASLAHEIRNPLAGVAMGLQNLERDAEDLGPRIRPMVSELERITRTLNEHLGALRAPAETPVEVDVSRLVSDMVELLRYEAADGVQVELSVEAGVRCRTQQDRLRQVLLNLALNGLQVLEPRGGTLRIEASRSGNGLALEVLDSGPGFPEGVLHGVTGPFASTRAGGVGLGLRLVRRMVGELGGTLELSNPAEGGARAVVRIPCAEVAS
jgi:signal transduction histidine kinase